MPLRVGIDLGGTKISGVLIEASGEVQNYVRRSTPQGDYQATLEAINNLIRELDPGGHLPVGIGIPGSPSPASKLIRNANSTCLNGQKLEQDLRNLTSRRIKLANDADCFALSESRFGAAREAKSVFGVIIGTGTGAGLVYQGQLLEGINAIAGEWGHNPLPWPRPEEMPGPECYCGKTGCIETFLSGPGLQYSYLQLTGKHVRPAEICRAAEQGDTEADACLDLYEDRLARSLATIINLFDPELIVLGGGLGNIKRLYRNLPARLVEYVFSDCMLTRIVPPELGDDSGVRGAACLW